MWLIKLLASTVIVMTIIILLMGTTISLLAITKESRTKWLHRDEIQYCAQFGLEFKSIKCKSILAEKTNKKNEADTAIFFSKYMYQED